MELAHDEFWHTLAMEQDTLLRQGDMGFPKFFVFFSDQTLCNYKVTKVLRTFLSTLLITDRKKTKKSLPGSKLTFVQHFKALNFEEKLTKEKKMFCLSQELVKLGSVLKCFSMIQGIQKIPNRRHNPGIFWERTQPTPFLEDQ